MSRPQTFRPCMVILSDAETARFVTFVRRVGHHERAMRRLGIGEDVFAAARGFGRMQSTTRVRVLAALDREEALG